MERHRETENTFGSRLIVICSVVVIGFSLLGQLGWKLGLPILFLGAGLFAIPGRDGFPLRLFIGPSARAKLLRAFLPVTVALILLCGFLTHVLYLNAGMDPVLLSSLSALVVAIIVGVVIFQITRIIGGEIDHAAMERKRAETALKKEHDEKQLYLDTAGVMLLALNLLGRITLINRKGCEILGYNEKDLLGRDWFEVCLPGPVRDEAKAMFNKLITGDAGPDLYYESPILTKASADCFLSCHHTVIRDELSRITGVFCSGEDITLRKRADEELRANIGKLRRFLGITVQIIEQLVERRDLYTAGHQKRVADLSRAIATYLELPSDTINALRVAASIHDIGKITIPAEILNKSSKLSELEFGIVKTHPQVGYDIMNDIEFPWPVSQIILQHHERVNGSGYPHGLTGEAISIEARIIAVADVVEAITARRPYRPAMGMDQALEEISRNSGTLYDPSAVDACLTLFDRGYELRM